MANKVTLIHAALDETPDGTIVLRGVLEENSLRNLQTDAYQREVMPLSSLASIIDAIKKGERLPDIELGMRGQRFKEKESGVFELHDPVFIIDGLQRSSAGLHLLSLDPGMVVRLGAMVHFGTTREWEKERFRILNTLRSRVSVNVLLRNMHDSSEAVRVLTALSTNDQNFVLRGRVCWKQKMARTDMITALTLAKTVGRLVAHKAPTRRNTPEELVPALDKAVEIFGVNVLRETVRTFFDLIEECWSIKRIHFREGAPHMKGTFLRVLATLLSDHHDFWKQPDERRLFVEAALRRKFASFPVHDQEVARLAASGGKAGDVLYHMLRDHINSGKRTKRLSSRNGDMVQLDGDEADDGSTTEEEVCEAA